MPWLDPPRPALLHSPCSYGKCGDFIQQHRKGLIELAPGCDADQSLEAAVTGVLNNIREQAAKVGGQKWGAGVRRRGVRCGVLFRCGRSATARKGSAAPTAQLQERALDRLDSAMSRTHVPGPAPSSGPPPCPPS